MTTRSQPEDQKQDLQDEPKQQEEEADNIKDEKLCSNLKTENWNTCSNSSQINETTDITSQILDQISQSENNEVLDEDLQDDEDDDPIHTFLNIERYFEKELITMVQAEEVLYNNQHPLYRNMKLKLGVWEEIARKLKRTVRQCRLKWKALRDQYIREHKRLLYIGNSKNLPRWKHYDALGFLEKFIRQKKYDIVKPELNISMEQLDQEQLIAPSTDQDHEDHDQEDQDQDQEMPQYIIGDDASSQIFTDCGHSNRNGQDQAEYTQKDKHSDSSVEEAADAQAEKDDNDEVGAFFRAIAIKIRKAKMSAMAFTELQIDILRVITNALRDH